MTVETAGGLLEFETPEGARVFVDPGFVVYIEPHGSVARLVFSGGFDLLVQNEKQSAQTVIGAAKKNAAA